MRLAGYRKSGEGGSLKRPPPQPNIFNEGWVGKEGREVTTKLNHVSGNLPPRFAPAR